MKKFLCLLLALITVFSLVACTSNGNTNENKPQKEKEQEIEQIITPISPKTDEYVFLTNDEMTEWIKNYSYSSSWPYAGYGDHFAPKESITLSWANKNQADYYILLIDDDIKMQSPNSYVVSGLEKTLTDLYVSCDYYWRVISYKDGVEKDVSKVFHFTTACTPRTILIDGVSNTRDLGGYMTTFGKKVKQGMVFRCGAPESITALGKDQAVYKYGIKTEIDLRNTLPYQRNYFIETGDEVQLAEGVMVQNNIENGSSFGHFKGEVNYLPFWSPSYTIAPTGINDIYGIPAPTGEINIVENAYEDNLTVSSPTIEIFDHYNDYQLARIMSTFANEDNYPIIFHCAAGRDRTGLIGCTLNALLGVCDEDLHIDYETSFFSQSGSSDDSHVPSFVTNFETILGYFNTFEGNTLAEKTANYLMTYGMTQDQINCIRRIMLEG